MGELDESPGGLQLDQLVKDFAAGMVAADAKMPQARGRERVYRPGIGPHSEDETVALVMAELARSGAGRYATYGIRVPYPNLPRQRCDLCLGQRESWEWAIEVKLLRLLGDNGKLNDNMLMHVLSPYPAHRSALTDCTKLSTSTLGDRKAILIVAYDTSEWPADLAIDAFERLASSRIPLGGRLVAGFDELVHPVHGHGAVYAWEIGSSGGAK